MFKATQREAFRKRKAEAQKKQKQQQERKQRRSKRKNSQEDNSTGSASPSTPSGAQDNNTQEAENGTQKVAEEVQENSTQDKEKEDAATADTPVSKASTPLHIQAMNMKKQGNCVDIIGDVSHSEPGSSPELGTPTTPFSPPALLANNISSSYWSPDNPFNRLPSFSSPAPSLRDILPRISPPLTPGISSIQRPISLSSLPMATGISLSGNHFSMCSVQPAQTPLSVHSPATSTSGIIRPFRKSNSCSQLGPVSTPDSTAT